MDGAMVVFEGPAEYGFSAAAAETIPGKLLAGLFLPLPCPSAFTVWV
jgi:hypothetical protein